MLKSKNIPLYIVSLLLACDPAEELSGDPQDYTPENIDLPGPQPPPPPAPPAPQFFPDFNVEEIGQGVTYLRFTNPGEHVKLEATPWIIPGGWRNITFASSSTHLWSMDLNLADESVTTWNLLNSQSAGPYLITSPTTWWNGYKSGSTISNTWKQWRRNHYSMLSAHKYYNSYRGKNIVIGYMHGENKNERMWENTYPNTIAPNIDLDPADRSTWAGNIGDGEGYKAAWDAYFGFVSFTWMEDTPEKNWARVPYWVHMPINWASNGYITNASATEKTSTGYRHPSSILHNDHIYIFCQENTDLPCTEPGRCAGIKVFRVQKDLAIWANQYETYFDGEWIPSLPPGVDKYNWLSKIHQGIKGPPSTTLFGNGMNIKFAVARIKGTPYFLGVEQYADSSSSDARIPTIALRISDDLVNWSERHKLSGQPKTTQPWIFDTLIL